MSSRARVRALVAAAAVAAAGIAVAVAWTGRAEEPAAATGGAPREGAPPLALDVVVADPGEAIDLRDAATLYESGRRQAALAAFEAALERNPDSLYAAVGAAFARWPDGTLASLDELSREHPQSALVELHRGLALFWLGDDAAAAAAWRRAEAVDPDSPAAVRAESLLHPEMPAGRPFFVPSAAFPPELADLLPLEQLAELERRAAAAAAAEPWILYGVALQRAGRPLSARAAFDRAVALEPDGVEALTAAALVRFDKDDPSQAFSRLGPLSQRFPDEPVVRFHLGLALLWLRELEDARSQLQAAVDLGAGTVHGRQAAELLARLDEGADASP